jgi:ribosomal protein S18 acetylase RimI-like enzyme
MSNDQEFIKSFVKKATEYDYEDYALIRTKLAEEDEFLPWEDIDKVNPQYFKNRVAEGDYKVFFLLNKTGDIVGFVNGLFRTGVEYYDYKVIIQIGILKEYRGQGGGKLLMDRLIKSWLNSGRYEFNLFVNPDNLAAIALYKKFSFEFKFNVIMTPQMEKIYGKLDYYELRVERPSMNPEYFNKLPILTVVNPNDLISYGE